MFEELRKRWQDYLLGGDGDLENPAVRIYLENLDRRAEEAWTSMIKCGSQENCPERPDSQEKQPGAPDSRSCLWEDLKLDRIDGIGIEARIRSNNITKTFYRMKDMALAWGTKGCRRYQDKALLQELIRALDFMNEKHYSEDPERQPFFGNWWDWEIGSPIALLDAALILYEELTGEQRERYGAAVCRYTDVCDTSSCMEGNPAMTGANLVDKAVAVVQTGILLEDGKKLLHVKQACKSVFRYVTRGDGFYRDGSYIQHEAIAYIGGYGIPLYEKLSLLFSVLAGTDYELTYPDRAQQVVFDHVFEGCEPFLYRGLCMNLVAGRSITRDYESDQQTGVNFMNALMLIGDAMQGEQQARFFSMMKCLIGEDTDYYFSHTKNLAALRKADRLMRDASIKPRQDYHFHRMFGGMDKLVHITPEFAFALSMHSTRTYGHELINDEGKRTWNISDGMTYLYNGDRDQYSGGYWATVDPKRLAGTTTEYVTRPDGAGDRTYGRYAWAGGSTAGYAGAAGMHLRTLGDTGEERLGADAKKSWFVFKDAVAAVGSGITSHTGNLVETIIENRKLRADGSNRVASDGNPAEGREDEAWIDICDDGPERAEKGTLLSETSWLWLEGSREGADIGYYFPEKTDVMALKETRTGNWSAQGRSEGEETNSFACFWLEHGRNPVDAGYAYVLLPGRSLSDMRVYAEHPDIEILERSSRAHGARRRSEGLTMVNFWEDGETTAGGITSDRAASVTMQVAENRITVGVADPEQRETGSIRLTLPHGAEQILSADPAIQVLSQKPFLQILVDVKGLGGRTCTLTGLGLV
ncbi:MAG: polysaccharide lyase 8 family protein [Lachnospiraceae bacterium]|nr:polysaccharide lyase 8 family protein [Lachnospiraceae bacterium]